MGTVPAVPTFPAGLAAPSAGMNELCTAITWLYTGRPLAQLSATTAESIAASTPTAIAWNTKIEDRDGGWLSGANTNYTAQTQGIYMVAAFIPWAANATGSRRLNFQCTTGSNNPAGSGLFLPFGGASVYTVSGSVATCVAAKSLTPYMYVGDFLEVIAWQSNTGSVSTSVTSQYGPPIWTIQHVSG
jgi:hypothetical protein